MLLFQKKHSTLKDKVWWGDEFNAERFFLSHNTSNLCGVLIVFLGTYKVTVKKIRDTEDKCLILDVKIAAENFVFIKLYNPNKKSRQIKIFEKLVLHIKLLNLDQRSQIVCMEDFNLFLKFSVRSQCGKLQF